MKETPEFKKMTPEKGEGVYKKEKTPDYYDGGATSEKAKEMEQTDQKEEAIADVKEDIESKIPQVKESDVEDVEKPFDISFLVNKIKEVENQVNNQGWFKKQFGGGEENLRRLKLGLRKVEDPKLKRVFLKGLEDSYKQGGEKLALEYVKSIGNGELVYPKDGVLMAKGSQESYFPQ